MTDITKIPDIHSRAADRIIKTNQGVGHRGKKAAMTFSSVGPRRPVRVGWEKVETEVRGAEETWAHPETGILVVSEVAITSFGAAEYCLMVSLGGERCSASLALIALADFDLLAAVEDARLGKVKGRVFRVLV